MTGACQDCLRRTWLLERLAGHLDTARGRIGALLALGDGDLIAAVAGGDGVAARAGLEAVVGEDVTRALREAGVEAICRCDARYPTALRSLGAAAPAVLHVADGLERFLELSAAEPAAIVGARRASPYALETARSLARGAGVAGVPVVSGLALGVDAAAHQGALDAGAGTIAVLPCAPERSYPAANRMLHRRILARGACVSELGPGISPRRWMFPARNRIIAALASVTVVVAARRRSGALVTARWAAELGRVVGAVPGQVTAPLSFGPHELLRKGAALISGPDDLVAIARPGASPRAPPRLPPLPSELQALLDELADGHRPALAFARAGLGPQAGLAALAELEMSGRVRRGVGGGVTVL
ncbi:MAG: DNA-processing protein DprA [Solirubrobacteraceae bacterium]